MEGVMKNKHRLKGAVGCLILMISLTSAFAGDVFSGKVTAVRSAEIIVVDYGKGQYIVRIAGIAAPVEGPIAAESKKIIDSMVLGKEVRARFVTRNKNGEMGSRLFVGDHGQEVGLELMKAGMVRRLQRDETDFVYKYGELTAAENEARKARRGLWAATPVNTPPANKPR